MNHYPRHVGDITQATFGLSLAEFGAYDRLLDAYYANEAPLPLDAKERYRMAGALTKADRAAVDYVLSRYFTESADGWHQKRADEEIARYQERADSARKNGANGGRPRNPTVTESVISANPTVTGLKANQEPEPVTSNQGRTKPSAQGAPDWVPSDAWEAWVKYRGKTLTSHARTLCIAELAKLMAAGDPPQDVIEQSIRSGWKGLFPLNRSHVAAKQSERQRVSSAIFGATTDERPTERVIDGEATRVA